MFLISTILNVLEVLIIARVILSFVPQWERHPAGLIVVTVTEPVLRPLRRVVLVGGSGMALDFSPMVALLVIHAVRLVLHICRFLFDHE